MLKGGPIVDSLSGIRMDSRKTALRKQIRHWSASITPEQRRGGSDAVVKRLAELEAWNRARWVLLYVPLPDELDLMPLLYLGLAEQKRICFPAFDRASGQYGCREIRFPDLDWGSGSFGIPEPKPELPFIAPATLDFLVIPGLAFDRAGCRLGRGKGYYDRLLAGLRGVSCGVGFDEQLVPEVPVEAHDVKLNTVLTPTHWVECSEASH